MTRSIPQGNGKERGPGGFDGPGKDSGRVDYYNLPSLSHEANGLEFEFNYYSEVESTMHKVEKHIRKGGGPVIFLTDHQTAGVGREGRTWHDKPGGSVLMSLSVNLKDKPGHVVSLADRTAIAVAAAISHESGKFAKIKYPNDVIINDKKTAGILVRNIEDSNGNYLGTNIGIGINVHYDSGEIAQIPTDYGATSIDEESGKFASRERIVVNLMHGLRYAAEDTIQAALNDKYRGDLNYEWRARSAVLGRNITILQGEEALVKGKVTDTKIGDGIQLEGRDWFNFFETEMKVRIN